MVSVVCFTCPGFIALTKVTCHVHTICKGYRVGMETTGTAGAHHASNGMKHRQDCLCPVATYQVKSSETRVICTKDFMFSEDGNPHVALIVCPSVKALSMISGCPMVLLAICSFRSKSMGHVFQTYVGNAEILPR